MAAAAVSAAILLLPAFVFVLGRRLPPCTVSSDDDRTTSAGAVVLVLVAGTGVSCPLGDSAPEQLLIAHKSKGTLVVVLRSPIQSSGITGGEGSG